VNPGKAELGYGKQALMWLTKDGGGCRSDGVAAGRVGVFMSGLRGVDE
jgi:hypothetical protein